MLLVTGATGFIGRHALELAAAAGLEVHALATRVPVERVDGVEYHAVDLIADRVRACELVRELGATHLLHLAWYAVPRRFWTAPENFPWASATLDLASAFAAGGGRRLVAAGTCAEYDWSDGVCVEDVTPLAPGTPYGVAKDATRRLLESWARVAGLRFAWGRIFFVYGTGEHPDRLVSSVIRSMLRGDEALCTEGTQLRDFLHVRDVADAFLSLVAGDAEGAFNIGSGEAVAVRDLIARIALQLGGRARYGAIPMGGEPPLVAADTRRLRETGWTPRFDLDAGLRDAIQWHRSNT